VKIEVGYWKTRDGRKARVLCTDAPNKEFPNHGYVELGGGSTSSVGWTASGFRILGREDADDLLFPWTEPDKLVPHWPTLCRVGDRGEYYIGSDLRSKGCALLEYEIRLLVELPPIMLPEEKA
jgi:hypothetical protein